MNRSSIPQLNTAPSTRFYIFACAILALCVGCSGAPPAPEPASAPACTEAQPLDCQAIGLELLRIRDATVSEQVQGVEYLRVACRQAATAGTHEACAGLGIVYETGFNVPQDDAAAQRYYAQACEGGSNCTTYAQFLFEGRAGDRDFAGAEAIFDRECVAGDVLACAWHGLMHHNGSAGNPNHGEALRLLRHGCNHDIDWACRALEVGAQ